MSSSRTAHKDWGQAALRARELRKAQTIQAPPAGQVWRSYYFQGARRLAVRVQVNGGVIRGITC
jgi:hypothetical protein